MAQTVINMTLYRLLLKQPGVTEAEAEQAAQIDMTALATKGDLVALKADLTAAMADLKSELLKTILLLFGGQVAVFATIVGLIKVFG